MQSRKKIISVVGNVGSQAVGTIIDSKSMLLMQRSSSSVGTVGGVKSFMERVGEILDDQNSALILKYPSAEDSQRSSTMLRSPREVVEQIEEQTEDILRRVQGTSRKSILLKLQETLGAILNQPDDTIAVVTFSEEDITFQASEAMMGYFHRNDDEALLVHYPDTSNRMSRSVSDFDDEDCSGMNKFPRFVQKSLHTQKQSIAQIIAVEPEITISRSGNSIVGVLDFPNSASAIVKTTVDNFPVEQGRSEMVRSMKVLLENLVYQSSDNLLIQMHSDDDRRIVVEDIKCELESIISSTTQDEASEFSMREQDDKIIGVLSHSGGSIVIQNSSKNWICASSDSDAENLLMNIRRLIEQFIINKELSEIDLRSLASIFNNVLHTSTADPPEEFRTKHVLQKIKFVFRQLLHPSDEENPLLIINQIRSILEDIAAPESSMSHIQLSFSSEVLKDYFEDVIRKRTTQYNDDLIIHTLRTALLNLYMHYDISLSKVLEDLLKLISTTSSEVIELELQSTVISSPGMTTLANKHIPLHRTSSDDSSNETVQQIHNLSTDEEPTDGGKISHISSFHTFFLTLLRIIGGWSLRMKSFLSKEPRQTISWAKLNRQCTIEPEQELEPEPELEPLSKPEPSTSIQRKPSVSFHLLDHPSFEEERTPSDMSQKLEEERQKLNATIDNLREFLKKSLNTPDAWIQQRKGSLKELPSHPAAVKQRMIHLFSKLLDEAGKLEITDHSHDTLHLRLDSASGQLERNEGTQFVKLNGKVCDRRHNLGLFFEARMVDLDDVSRIESELECVTEIRRLSDDSDQELKASEFIPETVESCLADMGSLEEEEEVQPGNPEESSLRETMSRYFELFQSYIQESIDPLRETMGAILERISVVSTNKYPDRQSSGIQTVSSTGEDYIVEMLESQEETGIVEVEEITQHDSSIHCIAPKVGRSIQYESLSGDQPSRLGIIECDVREIKQQITNLCTLLRQPVACSGVIEPLSLSTIPSTPNTESIAPTAPTLPYMEDHLSISLEVFPHVEEQRTSEEIEMGAQYASTTECPTIVESPISEEKLQGTTQNILDAAPIDESPIAEGMLQGSTHIAVDDAHFDNLGASQSLKAKSSEERQSIFSMLHRKLSSLITKPMTNNDQCTTSARVSILEPVITANLGEDRPEMTSDVYPTSISIPPQTSIISDFRETLIQSSRNSRTSDLDNFESFAPMHRSSSIYESKPVRQHQNSQSNGSRSPDKLKPNTLQLTGIPVRKERVPEFCEIVSSYQCKYINELGSQFISPAEIYSCHPVGPCEMMIHWRVTPQLVDQISEFKIYVDGVASTFYYSNRRRTCLLENIDIRKQHRIIIYCNPKSKTRGSEQWAPGVFFYHL